MLSPRQLATIADRTGLQNPWHVVDAVRACGFDPAQYRLLNADLQSALSNDGQALHHFLVHGYRERRPLAVGPLPQGLDALAALQIPQAEYAANLAARIFTEQLLHPDTPEWLWRGIDDAMVERVRMFRGLPFYILGDSHAHLYRCWLEPEPEWLAPMPLVCHGASAGALGNPDSRGNYGKRILRWAASGGTLRRPLDVPVFLKFGGMDAELLWVARAIRDGATSLGEAAFADHAQRSVAAYAGFLDRLAELIDPGMLRVCAIFPAALRNEKWTERFVSAFSAGAVANADLAAAVRRLEIPSLPARNRLRAHYNDLLRAVCTERQLTFVDDFQPFVAANGETKPAYLSVGKDIHLDFDAAAPVLTGIIRQHL